MQSIERGHHELRHRGAPVLRRSAGVAVLLVAGGVVVVTCDGQAPPAPPAATPTAKEPPARIVTSMPPPRASAVSLLQAKIEPTGYTSARVCGTCHVDIYNSWKNSLHAFSLSDPVFDTAYMQAIKAGGDEARRLCLRCHAPLTMSNGDWDLREGVTREGVTCDFCHTVKALHLDRPNAPFSLEPGRVKRSVLRKAASPVHEVAYSHLHETAEFCGACHNYRLADGTAIMSTYQEWRAGPYAAEGTPCQACHMVRGGGRVVSEELRPSSGSGMHLHDLIHDADQLRSAVNVDVTLAKRRGLDLAVEVVVANEGSGHMVPTGIPSRELVLTVAVTSGGRATSQERRFRKVLVDKDGQVLTRDFEMLLFAAAVVSDNRIRPRERRVERFTFAVAPSGAVKVTAVVTYVYSPLIVDQREVNIELAKAERFAS